MGPYHLAPTASVMSAGRGAAAAAATGLAAAGLAAANLFTIRGAAAVSDLADELGAYTEKEASDGKLHRVLYAYHEKVVWELPVHVRLECVRGTAGVVGDVELVPELLYWDGDESTPIVPPTGVKFDDGERLGGGAEVERARAAGETEEAAAARAPRHTVDSHGRAVDILVPNARVVLCTQGPIVTEAELAALQPGAVFYHTVSLRFHVKSCWFRDTAFRVMFKASVPRLRGVAAAILPPRFVLPATAVYVKAKPATTPREYTEAVEGLAKELRDRAREMATGLETADILYPDSTDRAPWSAWDGHHTSPPVSTRRGSTSSTSRSGSRAPSTRSASTGEGGGGGVEVSGAMTDLLGGGWGTLSGPGAHPPPHTASAAAATSGFFNTATTHNVLSSFLYSGSHYPAPSPPLPGGALPTASGTLLPAPHPGYGGDDGGDGGGRSTTPETAPATEAAGSLSRAATIGRLPTVEVPGMLPLPRTSTGRSAASAAGLMPPGILGDGPSVSGRKRSRQPSADSMHL